MLRHRFLTALATPAGPSLKTASRSLSSAGCSAWAAACRRRSRQRRVVAGEAGCARRRRRPRRRWRASRRRSTCRAGCCARRCCAPGRGCRRPWPRRPAGAPRRWRRRAPAALCLSCSTSACTGSSQERVMPSRRVVIGIAHAAARIVERPAAGARGRAAAAAARLLARHLALRPAHHAVELAAHRIEPRGDDGAGVARVLLQAGEARARRLLAGDQAPPEAVAEADRPDREEHVEREGDQPLAQRAAWRRTSRAASATSGT